MSRTVDFDSAAIWPTGGLQYPSSQSYQSQSPQNTQSPHSSTASPPSRPDRARQRRFGRTRTGCLTCRSRRKKCDERKPVCVSCQRNKLDCVFAPPVSRPRSQYGIDCCDGNGNQELWAAQVAPKATAPCRDTSSHYQTGLEPLRSHRTAVEPTTVLRVSGQAYSQDTARNSIPALLVANPSYQPVLQHPTVAALLYHFCHRSSQILSSVRGQGNPFLRLMIPVAMSNEQVLDAILALSGVHYHNLNITSTMDAFTWFRLGRALRKLRVSLEFGEHSSHHDVLPSLMTSVIFCILETVRGDATGTVAKHLLGVRKLLDLYHVMPGHDAELCAFMSEYYTYSRSLSNTTGVEGNTGVSDTLVRHVGRSQDVFHGGTFSGFGALCGCAHNLFPEIETVMAAIRLASLERDRFGGIQESTRLDLIVSMRKIDTWSPANESAPGEFLICGRLYQEATRMALTSALIYHNKADGLEFASSSNTVLQPGSVDASRFADLLSQLPVSSPSAQTLCWPLAVAGCCTSNIAHRAIIQETLDSMYEGLGIANYRNVSNWLANDVWPAVGADEESGTTVDVDKLFRTRWLKHGFA